jgi:hypothetical protein
LFFLCHTGDRVFEILGISKIKGPAWYQFGSLNNTLDCQFLLVLFLKNVPLLCMRGWLPTYLPTYLLELIIKIWQIGKIKSGNLASMELFAHEKILCYMLK